MPERVSMRSNSGTAVALPVRVMFWGDRYGQLRDPFGVDWSMNQRG